MQIFFPKNKPIEQEPECQAQERAEAARQGEATQGDTGCCQGVY